MLVHVYALCRWCLCLRTCIKAAYSALQWPRTTCYSPVETALYVHVYITYVSFSKYTWYIQIVCVWEIKNVGSRERSPVQLQLKHTLHGHTDSVTCIAASTAYNIIVSGSKVCGLAHTHTHTHTCTHLHTRTHKCTTHKHTCTRTRTCTCTQHTCTHTHTFTHTHMFCRTRRALFGTSIRWCL